MKAASLLLNTKLQQQGMEIFLVGINPELEIPENATKK
jgi:anti-anti-sigma regulatory factor